MYGTPADETAVRRFADCGRWTTGG